MSFLLQQDYRDLPLNLDHSLVIWRVEINVYLPHLA